MARLAGGRGLIEVYIDKAGAEAREGKTGSRGQGARGKDRQPHMGEGEKRFRQSTQISGSTGEAHNFIDVGAGFSELRQQAFEAEGSQFSFQGVGRKNQIPFGAAHSPEDPAETGQVGQFQIDGIGEREKGEEEKNPLAGAPVKGAALFPGPESEQNRQFFLGHGFLDFFRRDPLREQQVQSNLRDVDAFRGVAEVI
jgi:hypothetical protein